MPYLRLIVAAGVAVVVLSLVIPEPCQVFGIQYS